MFKCIQNGKKHLFHRLFPLWQHNWKKRDMGRFDVVVMYAFSWVMFNNDTLFEIAFYNLLGVIMPQKAWAWSLFILATIQLMAVCQHVKRVPWVHFILMTLSSSVYLVLGSCAIIDICTKGCDHATTAVFYIVFVWNRFNNEFPKVYKYWLVKRKAFNLLAKEK
jgi:hypothetical protein